MTPFAPSVYRMNFSQKSMRGRRISTASWAVQKLSAAWWNWAKDENQMISKNAEPIVKAGHRQLMQYLRSGDWTNVAKLPVSATVGALNRLTDYGWIERRGGGPRSEIRLTPAGLAALQVPI
jgi:hypothetical protein